jgi:hypothetical protein
VLRRESGAEATAVQTLARQPSLRASREASGLSTLRSNATEDGRRVHRRFQSASRRRAGAVLWRAAEAEGLAHSRTLRACVSVPNFRQVLECGGKRSATPLLRSDMENRVRHVMRKRRRHCVLPAQSKKTTVVRIGEIRDLATWREIRLLPGGSLLARGSAPP